MMIMMIIITITITIILMIIIIMLGHSWAPAGDPQACAPLCSGSDNNPIMLYYYYYIIIISTVWFRNVDCGTRDFGSLRYPCECLR